MNKLSDEYIRDLKPETMRYDVSLQSDFVISVLPNGIKTWAFLYEYQGRQRRKTLGVYPDMNRAQAARALKDARAMIERLGGELDLPVEETPGTIAGLAEAAVVKTIEEGKRPAVLASGYRPYASKRRTKPRPWGKYALAGMVAVALIIGATMLIRGSDRSGGSAPGSASTPQASDPAQQAPRKNPFAAAAVADMALTDGVTPAENAQNSNLAPAPEPEPEPEPGRDTGTGTEPNSTPPESSLTTSPAQSDTEREPTAQAAEPLPSGAVRSNETALSAEPQQSGPAADDDTAPSADTPQSGPAADDVAAPSADTPESGPTDLKNGSSIGISRPDSRPEDATAAPAASVRDAVPAGLPGRAAADADTAPPAATDQTANLPATVDGDASRVSPPTGATSVGGSVPRAVVTSGVDQLEPIDNLNDSVIESQGRFRSLFYFTELRSFSDGDIVHRWEYNGRLIADVPLKVRNSWRWRTYSSKDLLPGMTGDWAVSVVDARGDVLARTEFSFAD